MRMWASGTSGHTTQWSQSIQVPNKVSTACWNSAPRMGTSPEYSKDAAEGSELKSRHMSRKMLGAIRLLARSRDPSKCSSTLPLRTSKRSRQQAAPVNGRVSAHTLPQQPTPLPAGHRGEDRQLSITQIEFFGKCYFEVSRKETPAGMLELLKMVLLSDHENRKAEFVQIQKHFDCTLNLAIEALTVRASLGDHDRMMLDDHVKTDLLTIEMACTKLPPAYKNIIFAYLADHLPFPKCFLLVYVRFLRLTSNQRMLKELVKRLRETVEKEMPEQLQQYEWEFSMAKRLQWQQQADIDVLEPGTRCEQTIDSNLLPPPKFHWTKSTEELLLSILEAKMSMFPAEKKGGPSDSDRLVLFISEHVVGIWPEGWMDVDTILREAQRRL